MTYARRLRYAKELKKSWEPNTPEAQEVCWEDEPKRLVLGILAGMRPNLITSEINVGDPGEYHMPVIDVDYTCRLEPSSTPGHGHLFIDRLMNKRDYKKLLTCLEEVGILQYGVLQAFKKHGYTSARWMTTKQEEAETDG